MYATEQPTGSQLLLKTLWEDPGFFKRVWLVSWGGGGHSTKMWQFYDQNRIENNYTRNTSKATKKKLQ